LFSDFCHFKLTWNDENIFNFERIEQLFYWSSFVSLLKHLPNWNFGSISKTALNDLVGIKYSTMQLSMYFWLNIIFRHETTNNMTNSHPYFSLLLVSQRHLTLSIDIFCNQSIKNNILFVISIHSIKKYCNIIK